MRPETSKMADKKRHNDPHGTIFNENKGYSVPTHLKDCQNSSLKMYPGGAWNPYLPPLLTCPRRDGENLNLYVSKLTGLFHKTWVILKLSFRNPR